MSKFDLVVCKDGQTYQVGGSPLVMINGAVHTYGTDEIDEPYLKEWGWQCCTPDEKEIYRHLYQQMMQGAVDSVDKDAIINDITARLGTASKNVIKKVEADEYATFMMIDVEKFGIEEDELYTMCQRVMMDNPLTMFPLWPCMQDFIPAIKDANNKIKSVYSVVPTAEKRAQAIEICEAQIGKIRDLIEDLYGIRTGDVLTVEQKTWVLKVIHDYLVLHANQDDGLVIEWLQSTPYAVYDHRYEGLCKTYTMAFLAAARLYGIEAIYMSGDAYVNADNSEDGSYELYGPHAWVAVRLSDEEYGTYPQEPEKWSCIDVYWDEPNKERELGGKPARKDVIWKYFLDMNEINVVSDGDAKTGHSCRTIDFATYGDLPLGGKPSLNMPYNGNEIYIWEDDQ